jgi:hypothetical protein
MRAFAGRSRLFACLVFAFVGTIGIVADGAMMPAQAQDDFAGDFHEALAPYGQWIRHPRWGEVWVPANLPDDWAPYRYGHWVYTDDWGWYWVSDEDFGWIAYHYGRWIPDRDLGWVWIPGTDWSPAWVSWRRGDEAVGWAPMPPDDVIDEYEERPEAWVFVRPQEIFAPRITIVAFPRTQVNVFVQQTVIVNRTVFSRQGGAHVVANAGIPPSFIAAKIGHPIQTAAVQPHVLRGTVGIAGAVVGGVAVGVAIHETVRAQSKVIQPATSVPPPVRFKPGQANLGPDAPNALKQMHGAPSGPGPGPSGGQNSQGNFQHQQGNIQQQQQQQLQQQQLRGPSGGQGNIQEHQREEFRRPPPPPPPQVAKPAPPPPPQAAKPPPPPPPMAVRPPPPPPPPQAAKPAAKKCVKDASGKEVCK